MANNSKGYQTFRGNPENKLFYIIDNFMGGINTEFTDDRSSVADFEHLVNFDIDRLGTLHKRQGFGELTSLSDIFNLLGKSALPIVKNRTDDALNPEEDNDNIVYMKLLQNDNNCFRNLAGFDGKNGFRDYQKMYGFQNNTFKILIITTTILNKQMTASYAWYYTCTLPSYVFALSYTKDTNFVKNKDYYTFNETQDTKYKDNKQYFKYENSTFVELEKDKDYGVGENIATTAYEITYLTEGTDYQVGDAIVENSVCNIKDNIIIKGFKTELPVIFNWDRNLCNIENIEYYDKIYMTSNNKGLVCFDRTVDINSNEDLANAFSYSGFGSIDENGAYKPTAFEVLKYGYNLLGGDNLISYVNDSSMTSNSIQGCAIFNNEFKPTYTTIPASQDFKVGIYYTGQNNLFNLTFKDVDSNTTYQASDVTITDDNEHSRNGFKVYNVTFSSFPAGNVELKVEMKDTNIKPYYDYFTVGSVDSETLTVAKGINVGDCGIIFINDRAVYYKKDTIYFSQINDFTYVPSRNYITLPLSSTDEITKICYFKKSYIIFTKYQIHKMTGTFSLDSTDFKREIVNESLGCHAGNTVVPIDNTLYFASPRGIYALKSNQFVEGYENVTELDLKVKILTSDYTLYAEDREKPAIRYNGINEHAYAVRFKDKYLLFYNNYADKGDYAAENGLDVLSYQYEFGAYTTYRFKEKPTFLFMVDNAIETIATVKEKEEFTDEIKAIDYNFTNSISGNQVVDISGNGNNATMAGSSIINKSVGINLNGTDSYGTITDFDGRLKTDFVLNIDTKCDSLNGAYLIDLQQQSSTVLPTSGELTTNSSNGYSAKLEYTLTPNPSTNKDTVSYRLYYYGSGVPSNTGNLKYSISGSEGSLVSDKNVSFNISNGQQLVDTGTFTINRKSDGTYSSLWSLNISSSYITTTYGIEKGADVNLNDYYKDTTTFSWIKLGFTSFVAKATDSGCVITFTPAVKVTSGLRVGNRTLTTIIDGVEYATTVYVYTSNSNTGKVCPGTQQTIYLNYSGSKTIPISFRFAANFTRNKDGKYYGNLYANEFNVNMPSVTPYSTSTTNNYSLSGSNQQAMYGYGGESYRKIGLKINGENDQLQFILTSEHGEDTVTTDVGIGLLERHSWKVRVVDSKVHIYKDESLIKTQEINSHHLINAIRTVNSIGTDRYRSAYYKGTIYSLSSTSDGNTLVNYAFTEGSGNATNDTSQYNRRMTLNNVTWQIIPGLTLKSADSFLSLPKLTDEVKFSNGFKIEFEGIINSGNGIVRVVDFAKSYKTETSPIKFNSINVGFKNDMMAFNSTGSNGRTYRLEATGINTKINHKYIVDCVDNGNGYDISIYVDGEVVASSFFNYGGIADIVRNSNLIGKSNDSSENTPPKMELKSFSLTIYGNVSGIPVYRSSIYEFDTTPKDFGHPIYIDLKTKAYNLNYPQHLKKLKHTFIKLIGGDEYSELYFELYADGHLVNDPLKYTCHLDDDGTIVLDYYETDKNLEVNGTLSLLGSLVLDKTRLDESTYQTIKMIVPKKAKNFSFRIYGDSEEFLTIDSFGMVCKLGKVKQD